MEPSREPRSRALRRSSSSPRTSTRSTETRSARPTAPLSPPSATHTNSVASLSSSASPTGPPSPSSTEPLILWRDESNPRGLAALAPDDVKKQRLDAMLELFEAGEQAGVPVVGYVSSPGGSDVVNTLKVMLCPEHPVDCDRCPFTPEGMRPTAVHDKPCDPVARVTDAMLFRRMLTTGERSPLFWSSAPVLDAYGGHRVAFCYLDAGDEIARLELPAYVANSKELTDLAHWAAADQSRRGYGYPVALAEAHEQAIVRWADRDAFFRIVAQRFVREGNRVALSRKQLRKRGALV